MHTRTWLLAIACLVVFVSCRRVTVISFHADSPAPIDTLVVNLHSTGKHSVQLGGMDQQLGLYNLPDDHITISAFGCVQSANPPGAYYIRLISVLNGNPGQNDYSIVSDAVTVEMAAFTGDSHTPCPTLESDGAVSGEPSGAGGAAGAGNGGSDAGAGGYGGAAGGGVGGMAISGDGGIDAAGGAGGVDAGPGGNTGDGGCDDAGQHDTGVDAQICAPPPDPPQTSTAPTPTAACVDYCNQIVGTSDGGTALCPDAYQSVDQCLRYCTLVAWDTQVASGDTLACRMYELNMAAVSRSQPSAHSLYCASAGPSGGSVNMYCGADADHGGMCPTFCNAWAKICPGRDVNACLTACQNTPNDPCCRTHRRRTSR